MKLLRAGGPEQCTSALSKLHRSLIHEEKEKGELEEAIVLPLASSPSGCSAAARRQQMQLQILFPPAWICMGKFGCTVCDFSARSLNHSRNSVQYPSPKHCNCQGTGKTMHKLKTLFIKSRWSVVFIHKKEQMFCRKKSQKKQFSTLNFRRCRT